MERKRGVKERNGETRRSDKGREGKEEIRCKRREGKQMSCEMRWAEGEVREMITESDRETNKER